MTSGKIFLSHSHSLPTDFSGRPWGREALALDVAGESFRFDGLSIAQVECIRERHGHREVDAALDSGPTSTFFRAEQEQFKPLRAIDWSTIIDLDYAPGQVRAASYCWMCRIVWTNPLTSAKPHSSSKPGESTARGAVWTTLESGVPFHDLFENYFRLLVAYRLLSRGGLLVHSSAIADPSGAFLFPGASGAGKSTLARLALEDGRIVLSDDSNALIPGDHGPSVIGLPFGGELRERRQPTAAFPALGLMILTHGPRHEVTRWSRTAAVGLLLACSPFVNGDPHCRDRVLSIAEALVSNLPVGRLTFARQTGFWPHLLEFTGPKKTVSTVPEKMVPGTLECAEQSVPGTAKTRTRIAVPGTADRDRTEARGRAS